MMTEPARRTIPLLPTLTVIILVGVMIALGVWQLHRHEEKVAAIAVMRSNLAAPATIFPRGGPVQTSVMFRRSSVQCLRVARWQVEAGRAVDGSSGFRYIAHCVTGAEGPGALVAVGVGGRPDLKPGWTGGRVTGRIVEEPDHRSLLSRMTQHSPVLRPMLVSDAGLAGLKTVAPPDPAEVPDNHISYAVQWFLFAAIAVIIYGLALRRRIRDAPKA